MNGNTVSAATLTLKATPDLNGSLFCYYLHYCYRRPVIGSDTYKNAYSNIATLTVKSKAPVITKQPEDKAVNGATSFAIAATGTGTLTYQWYVQNNDTSPSGWTPISNGGVYDGAKTSILSLSGPPSGGYNFTYYCKVTNKNGSCQAAAVSSASASLLTLIIPDYVP
ncbi:MAG: hypothetical protein FWD23_13410, partial [Oscillospiraceae bacterium]|nr:hypothetical protein [Oscillospiraceae bacterium]